MQIKDWQLGLDTHTPILATFFEHIFKSKANVSVSDADSKESTFVATFFDSDTIVIRAVEKNFLTEVLIGFPESSFLPFSKAVLGLDKPAVSEVLQDLTLELAEKLLEQLHTCLLSASIQIEVSNYESLKPVQLEKALNLQQYFVGKVHVEVEGVSFALSCAVGNPNAQTVEQVYEEWGERNPFLEEAYVQDNMHDMQEMDLALAAETANGDPKVEMRGQTVEFEPFDQQREVRNDKEVSNIDLLRDVEMGLSVELGRREMPLGKILQLVKGSVIELERMAGEPVEIKVNGHTIASGDVVVIDEYFGVRVTNLLEGHNRITGLG